MGGEGEGSPTCKEDSYFFKSAEEACSSGIATFAVTRDECTPGHANGDSFVCACLK